MVPEEVMAACSTSKQKPARNSHLHHTMDELERPSARINATASRGCALTSHTVDLQHSKLFSWTLSHTHHTNVPSRAHTCVTQHACTFFMMPFDMASRSKVCKRCKQRFTNISNHSRACAPRHSGRAEGHRDCPVWTCCNKQDWLDRGHGITTTCPERLHEE